MLTQEEVDRKLTELNRQLSAYNPSSEDDLARFRTDFKIDDWFPDDSVVFFSNKFQKLFYACLTETERQTWCILLYYLQERNELEFALWYSRAVRGLSAGLANNIADMITRSAEELQWVNQTLEKWRDYALHPEVISGF